MEGLPAPALSWTRGADYQPCRIPQLARRRDAAPCPRRCLFEVALAASSCLTVQQNSMTYRVICCILALMRLPDLDFLVHDRLRSRRDQSAAPTAPASRQAECCVRCDSAPLQAHG